MTVAGAAPAVRRGRAGRRKRRALGFGPASLVLIAALVVEGRAVALFHTVTPWSSPDRMHVCGRDYHRAARVPARAAQEAVAPAPLQPRARGPLWQPVYGSPELLSSGAPCGTVLYLREGNGYRGYDLSGGP